MTANEAALYIHIPFCVSKCAYCDFFSKPSGLKHQDCSRFIIPDEYIDSLLNELKYRCDQFSTKSFTTVYIGGGTPSLLSVQQVKRILSAVKKQCALGAEITAECNPDDITQPMLDVMFESGVNRISVGIQCMDDKPLRLMNRRADSSANKNALSLLNTAQLCRDNVSFSADMISGLPCLSMESFISGLNEVIASGADHISLYSLTVEEGTPLAAAIENGTIEYSEEENENQWLAGCEMLEKAGFYQYEVSNFAKPGRECVHNMTYWMTQPYIGIGSGACGTVGSLRYTNTQNIDEYVIHPSSSEKREILDRKTQIFEFFMMGFRTKRGISSSDFYQRFGEDVCEYLAPFLDEQSSNKYGLSAAVLPCGNDIRYALNSRGLMFLNSFLTDLSLKCY